MKPCYLIEHNFQFEGKDRLIETCPYSMANEVSDAITCSYKKGKCYYLKK